MNTNAHELGKSYIIFSVAQPSLSDIQNKVHHTATIMQADREEISYKQLTGTYKGIEERGLIVPYNEKTVDFVKALMIQFRQEGYLKLDSHKNGMYKAYFVNRDGEAKFKGYLRSMPKTTIDDLGLDYCFFRADENTYYTIWDSDTSSMGDLQREVIAHEAIKDRRERARTNA